MFNVSLVGDGELVARFDKLPDEVQSALAKKVMDLTAKLHKHITLDKLHGQVLGIKSAALLQSVIPEPLIHENGGIYGKVYVAGNVKYAAFWEYGFHGIEKVREQIRTIAFGKTVEPFVVPAHSRKVDQDARSFMRSSLEDMHDEIREGLVEAVKRGMKAAVR